MSKRIIYTRPEDGGVSIVIPAPGVSIEEAQKAIPPGIPYEIVDTVTIPSDRAFRGAWEHDTTEAPEKIRIHLEKAQEITKERLRAEREPLLKEQDIAFQKALETGSDTSDVIAKKQRLRDITKLVDTESDIEKLKTLSCNNN